MRLPFYMGIILAMLASLSAAAELPPHSLEVQVVATDFVL